MSIILATHHGIGRTIKGLPSRDDWAVAADMAWTAKESRLSYEIEKGEGEAITAGFPDRKAIYRSDNGNALSIVGTEYHLVQPREVLDFFSEFSRNNGFELETAGSLYHGRKFWALARTGDNALVGDGDEIAPYMLLATSCDGSLATTLKLTTVRVVCQNTLLQAINEGTAGYRRTHAVAFDPSKAKIELGQVESSWANFMDATRKLAETAIDQDRAFDLLDSHYRPGKDESDPMPNAVANRINNVLQLFDGEGFGANLPTAKGTAWGLLNAFTQIIDDKARNKTGNDRALERAHLTDKARAKVSFANLLLAA